MRPALLLTVVLAPVLATTSLPAQATTYHVARKIAVGGEGGWDYTTIEGTRLYQSHGDVMVVVDLARDSVVGTLRGTSGIHGIAIATELGRGFTSNGRDTTVTIFDLTTLSAIGTVKVTGANPDAIRYDPASGRVFTFNGRGLNATAINAKTGTVDGTIPLGVKPEFTQVDGKGQLFVNLESDTGQVAILDTRAMKELKRYPLPGCTEPSGLGYDARSNRLFSACSNKQLAVSDPSSGKVVALVPIGAGADAATWDAARGLVFVPNGGDGTLTVIKQVSPDRYEVQATVPTQRGARTMGLDTRTHRIYLATAEFGPPPATPAGGRPARPPMIPGSFTILVVEPGS